MVGKGNIKNVELNNMAISKAIILKHITLFLGDKRETCFFYLFIKAHLRLSNAKR